MSAEDSVEAGDLVHVVIPAGHGPGSLLMVQVQNRTQGGPQNMLYASLTEKHSLEDWEMMLQKLASGYSVIKVARNGKLYQRNFWLAGGSLRTNGRFSSGAWHLRRWAGSLTALGWLWWPWSALGRRLVGVAPCRFCVAGVALGDVCFTFVRQAWHLVTSTCLSCGRRGIRHCAGSGGGIGRRLVAATHFGVAGVALGDIHSFVWQVWHLQHWAGSVAALVGAWKAWHLAAFVLLLCGRRGTW
eukprot:s37_g9.t1